MGLRDRLRFRRTDQPVFDMQEKAPATVGAGRIPERTGYTFGVPSGGLTEYMQGVGESTQSDRRSQMQQLYEAYLACPWSWACVQAIARTITAGGLVTDWDTDTGEGDQETPDKPPQVLALEKLLGYTNPTQDIRQLLRNVIVDLLVFGDAYIEVVRLAGVPVALYNLDSASMYPIADDHGQITGYVQRTELGQRADFAVDEVIHIALDAPRAGIFGVSPTSAATIPITSWLFAAATQKEIFRKGVPAEIHADFPGGVSPTEMTRWRGQYLQQNVGPRNIGNPVITKGQATVHEMQLRRLDEIAHALDQKRDEILASYGVPPSKVGVIESGNLGGGTGESQDKTFKVNTCSPIAELVLEKINYHIVREGFGISGWHLKFRELDMRDSKTIEDIRDARLRNGAWTLNRYRAEIGEPPVDGGDDAVLVDRQNLVLWSQMATMSRAMIAKTAAPGIQAGAQIDGVELAPTPAPAALAGGGDGVEDPDADQLDDAQDTARGEQPTETHHRVMSLELWRRYTTRRREAIEELADDRTAA